MTAIDMSAIPNRPYPLWTYNSTVMTIDPSVFKIGADGKSMAHGFLVRWGNDGWDLTGIISTGKPNEYVFFFKRPMQPGEYVDLSA
jgi:hypothetical protein